MRRVNTLLAAALNRTGNELPAHFATCRALITKGAQALLPMRSGRTLLCLISLYDYDPVESYKFCMELIEQGCDPNIGSESARVDIVKNWSHEKLLWEKAVEMAFFVQRIGEKDLLLARDGFLRIYWTLLVLNKRLRLPLGVVHQILISNTELAQDVFKLFCLTTEEDEHYKTPYRLRKPLSEIPALFQPMIFKEAYRATMLHLNELAKDKPTDIEQQFGKKIEHNSRQKLIAYN